MRVDRGDRQRLRTAPGERDRVGARIGGQSVGEVGRGDREHEPVPGRDRRTTDGRVTVTVPGAPGVRPVSRTGLTRPDGNTSVSDPTSCRATNRIASVVVCGGHDESHRRRAGDQHAVRQRGGGETRHLAGQARDRLQRVAGAGALRRVKRVAELRERADGRRIAAGRRADLLGPTRIVTVSVEVAAAVDARVASVDLAGLADRAAARGGEPRAPDRELERRARPEPLSRRPGVEPALER